MSSEAGRGGRKGGGGGGRGRGGGGSRSSAGAGKSNSGNNNKGTTTDSSRNNKNKPNKGKPQQQQKEETVVAAAVASPEELERREAVRQQELAAAQAQKQQAASQQKEAAREKERGDRTAAVREAVQLLRGIEETAALHASNRQLFATSENLKQARADFAQRKKSLKADLKKCTAFVKKIKIGTMYSSKTQDVQNEANSLNLSRYVEEVVAALLESKPKVNDLPVFSALCQAMHANYAEFLPNLLPSIWGVVLQEKSAAKKLGDCTPAELSKLRRLYVRLLTDFALNGLLSSTDVNKLTKNVAEWTGAANNYAVQDAIATVAFSRAASFEMIGILTTSLFDAMQLIRTEHDKLEQVEKHTNAEEGSSEEPAVVVSRKLLEEGLEVLARVQVLLKEQRAVPAATVEILSQHCLGAYETLSTTLVQTHHKLQKLEKRCDQDRLLSGTLPAAREKGLADARKLTESLQKSVEALSDSLNQPVPQLIVEEDDDDGERGTGVELWTKDAQGEEHLGPFDDEETRAFYCDIPDLLTTIPPALLGLSEEEIERRKEANAKKYGAVGEEQEVEGDDSAPDVTPTSEAQLDADEEEGATDGMSEGEDADEENKDTPHYRLMLLLEQELPECHRREQIDEIAEKFCTNFGSSKKSRKRLLKTLFLVPRSRMDLLPYYSRMATTLDRVWNDIASSLATDLEQQFHGQAKYKKNQNMESRMRTARYIGELTKFGAAPPIVALRCLQRCIEDFTGSNVDVACCILESCGRFLFRMKHTTARVTALMETMTRLSKAKNLDERLQSLLKAAFYSVKPPQSGPRKKAKEYPPLESYLRNLLLVRLEPTDSSISLVTKQLVRLPWDDPSHQCGALVTKIMLKACRKGRYKTIEAIAAVSSKLRGQRAAGEVTIRLIDAVIEELRWALENPNFRDQQRVITYARLLGEMYGTSSQVSGQVLIDQLYDFINVGHEIPDSLREASKKMAAEAASSSNAGNDNSSSNLPVYNSSGRVSQAIQEDEEMEEAELETNVEDAPPEPVAVSAYSKYDPRVPTAKDPPNSSYRITLVCTLLEVVAKSLVSRNNIPRLKGFLAAFQRYLFTKTVLPTDVEFALLDTFDIMDSQWKRVLKGNSRGGATSDTGNAAELENGFPRYASWLDAHNATVAIEEEEAVFEVQKRARLDAMADESKSLSEINDENSSMNGDDAGSMMDEDEDESTVHTGGSEEGAADYDMENGPTTGEDEEGQSWVSDDDDDNEEDTDDSEGETDDEEEEFDEEAYMRQLEEEAFERELRLLTKDALEKGKSASRKQVGDSMISGSQIVKKKPTDVANPTDTSGGMVLGGGAGISFQVLKKGNKGKVEARELVVPVDTNLAMVATKQDDAKAREKEDIKRRVLTYEAQSAEAEITGGNVYLEQEKLQRNRNKTLSMAEIDKNFGTQGGNLHPSQVDKKPSSAPAGPPAGRGRGAAAARGGAGPGRGAGARGGGGGRGRGGRGGRSSSGRTLFGS